MEPDAREAAKLWDMVRYCRTIERLIHDKSFDDYQRDESMRLAVERAIEIIGEAARGLSDEFRDSHDAIPWRAIIAQRHIISHEYGELSNAKLWRVATKHVPALLILIEPLIPQPPIEP